LSRNLEKDVQRKVVMAARKAGWIALKQNPTGTTGYPDYMFLKKGVVRFIEFKSPTGKTSPIQDFRIEELEKQGFSVMVTSSEYEGKLFLDIKP